jgi:hypothetical protein
MIADIIICYRFVVGEDFAICLLFILIIFIEKFQERVYCKLCALCAPQK